LNSALPAYFEEDELAEKASELVNGSIWA